MQIFKDFPITTEEYELLEKQFGNLCEYAAWEYYKRNVMNNHINEQSDFSQELRAIMITAGSYYKRQNYIENCLNLCKEYVKDEFMARIVEELCKLWKNKTKHGANKQKFGPHQENLLEVLTNEHVPSDLVPDKKAPLEIDTKFENYCKYIIWNKGKEMGRKITKERAISQGLVSLSDYEYLAEI